MTIYLGFIRNCVNMKRHSVVKCFVCIFQVDANLDIDEILTLFDDIQEELRSEGKNLLLN